MASATLHESRLDNGLRILLRPMHTAPIVSTWIWYGVGSRCERPGITGISHWVEHMLFKGTPAFPKGAIFKSISRVGGVNNGFTREDDTVYFETLPAEHFELALRLEASRMTDSLFDADELASERSVIISELEGGENQPVNRLFQEVQAAAYQVHPYHWPVIGHKCDLLKMTRDDLFAYYREFYAPDNATLVIVGDVEIDPGFEAVKRSFGDKEPAGHKFDLRAEERPQVGERRVEVRQPGNAVYWCAAYHVPAYGHDDRLPLLVLEAVLSGARPLSQSNGLDLGKSARLYDVLVNRKKLAAMAAAHVRLMKDPGLFYLYMMLRDGVRPEAAERAMFHEIDRLQDRGPTPTELTTARRQVQAQVEYARDGVSDNAYLIGNQNSLGDLAQLDNLFERISAVTAADVTRVARAYLTRANRTVGVFIPENGAALTGSGADASDAAWRAFRPPHFTDAPTVHATPKPAFPPIQERRLDCGIRLLGIENRDSHAVAVDGFLNVGAALDPSGKEGLAFLAARMLDQGTARQSCRQIALASDRLGASLSFSSHIDSTSVEATCLPRDFGRMLRLQRECLAGPAAPVAELEKMRLLILTGIRADQDSTHWMAAHAANEALYPAGHPYRRDSRGTAESLATLTREDVLAFARQYYVPANLTLAIVAPMPFDRVCREVEKAYAGWPAGQAVVPVAPTAISRPASPGERLITMPGKSQCDVVVSRIAIPRAHPDYYAVAVASSIFGRFGLFGRIGANVRDKLGLAYYAYSQVNAGLHAGDWSVLAGVNPANARRALEAITVETQRLCGELVTEEELSDSKGSMLGSLPIRMETSASMCSLLHDIAFFGLPLDYLERYRVKVGAVTRESVLDMARKYLADPQPVIVVAGPELPA